MSDHERDALRKSVRADRMRALRHVGIGLLIAISVVVVLIVILFSLGDSGLAPEIFTGVVIMLIVGSSSFLVWRRREAAHPQEYIMETTPDQHRFTNIAFSEKGPTWRGWKRDIGSLTIHHDGIVIDGLKGSLRIDAPFSAAVRDERNSFWPMVVVSGASGSAYLIVRGAPRSKFAADPEGVARESAELAAAINSVG